MTQAGEHDTSPLRIDPADNCVWLGSHRIALRPTPLAILGCLAERIGQVVSKEDVLQAVWPNTRVSNKVLKAYIQQLRKALGDDAKAPRFIETVQRRGYRFVGKVVSSQYSVVSSSPPPTQSSVLSPQHAVLVGRDTELAHLHHLLEKATASERQIVFVTGEPGIGKTALVETFLRSLESSVQSQEENQKSKGKDQRAKIENSSLAPSPQPLALGEWLWVGRGQCIEHYGAGEAYLPILDALGRLSRGPQGEQCVPLLRQYAPTWLLLMPWLLGDDELDALRQRTQGGSPTRMLREFAALIEALRGAEADPPTLVLVLEDLHWSDSATLDLLSFLARRREPARLMIVGTYRPHEATSSAPTLRAITGELLAHGNCEAFPLPLLNEQAVATYVTQQLSAFLPTTISMPDTIRAICERTEGNPLFMVSVVQHMCRLPWTEGAESTDIVASALSSVPSNVQQLIEKQLALRPPEEQQLLECASMVGVTFSTAAIAAGLAADIAEVESRCSSLARRGLFLQEREIRTWPDGTVTGIYGFAHAVYQQVLMARLARGWRAQLHRRIGERLEAGFVGQATEIATELVLHFEQAQEFQRVIPYCLQAGQTAFARFGYREAALLLDKGLTAVQHLSASPERNQQEVMLLLMRVAPFLALEGYGSEGALRTLTRLRALCEHDKNPYLLSFVHSGLAAVTLIRGDLPVAHALGEQALTFAQQSNDTLALVWAHLDVGESLLFRGEIANGHEHFLQGKTLGASLMLAPETSLMDPGIMCAAMSGWSLCALGYADQALATVRETLDRARRDGNPYALCVIIANAGAVYGMCGDGTMIEQLAHEALTIAREHNMPFWTAWGTTLLGAAFAIQGRFQEGYGIGMEGIEAQRAVGCHSGHAGVLAFIAECCARQGEIERGFATLAEAEGSMHTTGEYFWQPRLLQITGELLLQAECETKHGELKTSAVHLSEEAEAVFQQAINIARSQGAKLAELQAVTSLCRLWRIQGKTDPARKLLATIYGWFTEGFATAPLREAQVLLDTLG